MPIDLKKEARTIIRKAKRLMSDSGHKGWPGEAFIFKEEVDKLKIGTFKR
jgi:hypothetical protein